VAGGSNTGYVYTLSDPRTGDPRYVGATVNPQKRLKAHLNRPHSDDLASWIQDLAEQDLEPEMNVVQIDDVDGLADAERRVLERVASEHNVLNEEMAPTYALPRSSRTGGDVVESENLPEGGDHLVYQTLINTRVENPIKDVEKWVNRLTALGDGLEHTRDVDPSLLTENEAEVIVRYYGTHQTRQDVAEAMALSPNRIDRLRHAAEEDLLAAEATVGVISELRQQVRPDPHE